MSIQCLSYHDLSFFPISRYGIADEEVRHDEHLADAHDALSGSEQADAKLFRLSIHLPVM